MSTRVGAILLGVLLSPTVLAEEHDWQFTRTGENNIAWSCRGSGEVTITLIAGMGLGAHRSFGNIYHGYEGPGRICMYDRAGMGKSKFAQPAIKTLAGMAAELKVLGDSLDWGKQILVAHSFGGLIARAYAATNPDQVLGIIFMDSVHEKWLTALEQDMSADDYAIMTRSVAWEKQTSFEDFPEALAAIGEYRISAKLPLTVLSRGMKQTNIRQAKMSYEGIDIFNQRHRELQSELVGLSDDSRHVVMEYSAHFVDESDPWLVVDEIEKMVARTADD